jgi:hypothetical protein
MDKLTVRKIVEVNLKKGKVSKVLKNNDTLETYNNFIDAIDERYKLAVCNKLSKLDTPIILVKYPSTYSYSWPLIYCFDNNYYILINAKTTITTDIEEVLDLIDKHFYE